MPARAVIQPANREQATAVLPSGCLRLAEEDERAPGELLDLCWTHYGCSPARPRNGQVGGRAGRPPLLPPPPDGAGSAGRGGELPGPASKGLSGLPGRRAARGHRLRRHLLPRLDLPPGAWLPTPMAPSSTSSPSTPRARTPSRTSSARSTTPRLSHRTWRSTQFLHGPEYDDQQAGRLTRIRAALSSSSTAHGARVACQSAQRG